MVLFTVILTDKALRWREASPTSNAGDVPTAAEFICSREGLTNMKVLHVQI